MRELKATTIYDAYWKANSVGEGTGILVYLKPDVDKVIEDITKGAISMFRESSCCRGLDLKSALGRIADEAFKHWNRVEYILSNNRQLRLDKANLLSSNENLRLQLKSQTLERQTNKLEYALNIRHQKIKRCEAMADYCSYKAWYYKYNGKEEKFYRWMKFRRIWVKLYNHFKEAK